MSHAVCFMQQQFQITVSHEAPMNPLNDNITLN